VIQNPPPATTIYSPKPRPANIKKLWNGEYFSYDTLSEYKDNRQADQLAGQCTYLKTVIGLSTVRPAGRPDVVFVFAQSVVAEVFAVQSFLM